jgi:thioredoxin 1
MPIRQVKSLSELELILDVAHKENKSVIMDSFATWCGPCKKIAPQFEKLSQSHPKVVFIKTDIDIAQDIAEQFSIESIPTFFLFKNKNIVKRYTGASIDEITKMINL